ncbi:MAG TPA: Do family serine endopeptidase [Verrucomicrobiae bacterium]|jgi:serine protease Do
MKLNCISQKFAALLLGGAVLAGTGAVVLTVRASDQATKVKSLGLVVDNRPLDNNVKISTSFAPIVKRVVPSVVKVEVTIPGKEAEMGGLPDNPLFRQFFGDQFGGGHQKFMTPPERGVGSGVIVTKDGYILTNNHVVDGANEVKVTLNDGRQFKAKVVGRDPQSDVAVVKIDAHDLPAITFADSSQSEVGDIVLAVGNPFAIGQSVTMGIISATGRGGVGIEDYEDFIQTDAAINPGNSGGALVDAEGRLVGINTAIYSRSGGNQGIGFAIPTDLAKGVMVSLIEHGKVTRGYLGVRIQDITPLLAKEFNLKNNRGALVGEVESSGPAARAGLKSGDVILSFNGHKVTDSTHLRLEVAETAVGERVPVEVQRGDSTKTLEVKLKEIPGQQQLASNDSNQSAAGDTLQGVGVSDIDSQTRQQMSIPEDVRGAVVTEVAPNSASAQAGLKAGDVITEINHHEVAGANDAVRLTEHSKTRVTLLHVWSKEGSHFLVVDESAAG